MLAKLFRRLYSYRRSLEKGESQMEIIASKALKESLEESLVTLRKAEAREPEILNKKAEDRAVAWAKESGYLGGIITGVRIQIESILNTYFPDDEKENSYEYRGGHR